ncbi:MAG: hypothetical protein WBM28_12335 [Burkholderiales bacterium]
MLKKARKLVAPIFWPSLVLWPLVFASFAYWYCHSYESTCKIKKDQSEERKAEANKPNIGAYLPEVSNQSYSKTADHKAIEGQNPSPCSGPCDIVKNTLDDPVALFTAVLSYFVYLQLLWIARQEWWMRVHERAYVYAYPRYFKNEQTDRGDDLIENSMLLGRKVHFVVDNFGRTPAIVRNVEWKLCTKSQLLQEPEYGNGKLIFLMLHPGEKLKRTKADLIDYRIDWTEPHFIYGRVIYEDVFHRIRKSGFLFEIKKGAGTDFEHFPVEGFPDYDYWE